MTRQPTYVDIIMNYVALQGIAEIDNIFTETLRDNTIEKMKDDEIKEELEDDAIKYKRESCKSGKDDELVNSFAQPSVPEMSFILRVITVVYQVERHFYKGIYFYILPYLVAPLSYYVYEVNLIVRE